jgi:hypothetical protein
MAKQIIVDYLGDQARFEHKKVDRSKLYGKRRRMPLDLADKPCQRAALSGDGLTLVQSGMTAQGYFDEEDNWIPNKKLLGMDLNGQVLDKVSSTLGVAQSVESPSEVEDLLDLSVLSVYQLEEVDVPAAITKLLSAGKVLNFPFNYRSDFHPENAYLVLNDEGYFVLVGNKTTPEWMELGQIVEEIFEEEEIEDSDELDFEMF